MSPRFIRLALLCAMAIAAAVVPVRLGSFAQAPAIAYWTFESIHGLTCASSIATLTGFGFDPDNQPIASWNESNGCANRLVPWWSRRSLGAWHTNEIDPKLRFLGGADSDEHHALAIMPDGTPWLWFEAVFNPIDGSGNNSYYVFRSNLADSPTAHDWDQLQSLIGPQECNGAAHYPRVIPGVSIPEALTTLNLCGRGRSRMWLGGQQIATDLAFIHAADMAVGPDGTRHIIRITDGAPFYSTGAGPAAQLFVPGSDDLMVLGRFANEAEIEVDGEGLIHLVVSGLNELGDGAGHLGYLTSPNGAGWSAIEYLDTTGLARAVTMTLDRNGAPAVAFWRTGELWYGSRATGAWTFGRVTAVPHWAPQTELALAFDLANQPAIAFFDPAAVAGATTGAVRIARPAEMGANFPIDLAASITASPQTAAVGEPITVRATATNLSIRHAANVTLTVQLPAGASYLSSDPAPLQRTDRSATYALGELMSHAAKTVTLRMAAGSVRMLTTTAEVSGSPNDPVAENNRASITTAAVGASCFPSTSGMRGWFRAEGDTSDAIAGIAGEIRGGVSFTEGIRGQGFGFDGVSGRIAVTAWDENQYLPITQSLTVQAWIKTTASGAIVTINEGGGVDSGSSRYALSVGNGRLDATLRGEFGLSVNLTGSATIADGAFHHVAMVLDRAGGPTGQGEARIYVDGVLDGTADASQLGAIHATDSERDPLIIGGRAQLAGPDTSFFTGVIDELAISLRAMGAAEIQSLAAAPAACSLTADSDGDGVSDGVDACPLTPPGSSVSAQGCPLPACDVPRAGLTSFWAADHFGDDIIGGNEAFLMNGAIYGSGIAGEAFKLNGGGAWINVPHHSSLNVGAGDFTVSLWVNFNSTSGEQLLAEKYVEIWAPNAPGWLITKLADNRLLFYGNDGAPAFSAPMAIPTNTWIHIAGVKRAGATTLFMNGQAIATGTSGNVDTLSSLKFGKRGGPDDTPGSADTRGFFLNGSIDEPAFFRVGLSDAEILGLAQRTAPPMCVPPAPEPLTIEVTEAIAVMDEVSLDPSLMLSIDEAIGVADDVSIIPSLMLNVEEPIGVADDVPVRPSVLLAIEEPIGVQDTVDVVPVPLSVDGRLIASGFVAGPDARHHFSLSAERAGNAVSGAFRYWVAAPRRQVAAFDATAIGEVTFAPDRSSVVVRGHGKWNGAAGHFFEVQATAAGPHFSVTVRNFIGTVVGRISGPLGGGTIRVLPLRDQ